MSFPQLVGLSLELLAMSGKKRSDRWANLDSHGSNIALTVWSPFWKSSLSGSELLTNLSLALRTALLHCMCVCFHVTSDVEELRFFKGRLKIWKGQKEAGWEKKKKVRTRLFWVPRGPVDGGPRSSFIACWQNWCTWSLKWYTSHIDYGVICIDY